MHGRPTTRLSSDRRRDQTEHTVRYVCEIVGSGISPRFRLRRTDER
jgi:hypothetical protein